MGFSHSSCSILPLGAGDSNLGIKVPLSCSFGVVGEVHSLGINPKSLYPNNFCEISNDLEINNEECSLELDRDYINETL